jgi:hypothetical protein
MRFDFQDLRLIVAVAERTHRRRQAPGSARSKRRWTYRCSSAGPAESVSLPPAMRSFGMPASFWSRQVGSPTKCAIFASA